MLPTAMVRFHKAGLRNTVPTEEETRWTTKYTAEEALAVDPPSLKSSALYLGKRRIHHIDVIGMSCHIHVETGTQGNFVKASLRAALVEA